MHHENPQVEEALRLAKAGQRSKAREMLRAALKADRDNLRGWRVMAQLATTPQERRYALRRVIELAPGDAWAEAQTGQIAGQGRPSAPPSPPPADEPAPTLRPAPDRPRPVAKQLRRAPREARTSGERPGHPRHTPLQQPLRAGDAADARKQVRTVVAVAAVALIAVCVIAAAILAFQMFVP